MALIVLGTEIGNLIYFRNNFPEGVTTGNLLLYAASESISALMVVACLTLCVWLLAMWWDSHKKKQQQIIWKAEKEAESILFEAKNDANHRIAEARKDADNLRDKAETEAKIIREEIDQTKRETDNLREKLMFDYHMAVNALESKRQKYLEELNNIRNQRDKMETTLKKIWGNSVITLRAQGKEGAANRLEKKLKKETAFETSGLSIELPLQAEDFPF